MGRLTANINDIWFASASLRRDGSSDLEQIINGAFSPPVSAGVNLSKVLDIPSLDNLKLRVGYGVTGTNVGD